MRSFLLLHLGRGRNLESNMVDTASGAFVGEWDGRREPMGESDREQYCIGGWRNVDKE